MHNSLLFAPSKAVFSSPSFEGIGFEDVYIDTEDGETLHGYFLPHIESTKNTVIYLHGNGDNVSAWYSSCVVIQKEVNVNCLLVDYRGYGKSTGTPTRQGAVIDVIAMYDFLLKREFLENDISIYGRSLGGALALELALKRKVKAIVVQSSFTCIKDIAKDLYPIIPSPFIKNEILNSIENVKKINYPILIAHGSNDELINVKHAYKLFEAANQPKELIIHNGAMHNDIENYFNDEYFSKLKKLFC